MQQEKQIERIVSLIGRQIRGELNSAAQADLQLWINERIENSDLFDELTQAGYRQAELMKMKNFTSAEAAFANFMEKYDERMPGPEEEYFPMEIKVRKTPNFEYLKYVASILFMMVLATSFFFYLESKDLPVSNGVPVKKTIDRGMNYDSVYSFLNYKDILKTSPVHLDISKFKFSNYNSNLLPLVFKTTAEKKLKTVENMVTTNIR